MSLSDVWEWIIKLTHLQLCVNMFENLLIRDIAGFLRFWVNTHPFCPCFFFFVWVRWRWWSIGRGGGCHACNIIKFLYLDMFPWFLLCALHLARRLNGQRIVFGPGRGGRVAQMCFNTVRHRLWTWPMAHDWLIFGVTVFQPYKTCVVCLRTHNFVFDCPEENLMWASTNWREDLQPK